MSEIKHTPGPWETRGTLPGKSGAAIDIHGDGVWVGSANGNHNTKGSRPTAGFPGNDEGNANARLMAAAPELLVALKKALYCICLDANREESIEISKAAIVKAEGETIENE